MLDAYTIIGFIGALVLMVGFLMNQLGRWETTDFEYDFINLIGAAILAVYAWQIGSYPFLILFVVWTLFSLKDVVGDGFHNIFRKRKDKPAKEEKEEEKKGVMSEMAKEDKEEEEKAEE